MKDEDLLKLAGEPGPNLDGWWEPEDVLRAIALTREDCAKYMEEERATCIRMADEFKSLGRLEDELRWLAAADVYKGRATALRERGK